MGLWAEADRTLVEPSCCSGESRSVSVSKEQRDLEKFLYLGAVIFLTCESRGLGQLTFKLFSGLETIGNIIY